MGRRRTEGEKKEGKEEEEGGRKGEENCLRNFKTY